MKQTKSAIVLLFVISLLAFPASDRSEREQCTAAVISPLATADGAPILWKNRDTGTLSNKVVYVKAVPFNCLVLVNAGSTSGRHAWAGLNSAGFAIMNTVAYNLPEKPGEVNDLEGIIMADALRICRTVDDFEEYVRANLGPELGSWANYGVMDASGKAFIYEVHNHGYEKFDAASASDGYLVVTNFARSGKENKGAGYLRFERASQLFQSLPEKQIAFQDILSHFTRDIGHVLLRHPSLPDLKSLPAGENRWLFSRDCIDRPITSAAVVMVGKNPSNPDSLATMWVIPGEPLSAVAVPLWVEAGSCPKSLWEGEEAPMWQESLRIKDILRPLKEGNKRDYINLTRLDNADGTGYLPLLLETEKEIIKTTLKFLNENRTSAELAAFGEKMVEKALSTLKKIPSSRTDKD
jgi:hypothetical protein